MATRKQYVITSTEQAWTRLNEFKRKYKEKYPRSQMVYISEDVILTGLEVMEKKENL